MGVMDYFHSSWTWIFLSPRFVFVDNLIICHESGCCHCQGIVFKIIFTFFVITINHNRRPHSWGCNTGLVLWCLTPFQQYFSKIVAVSFIGGGNRSVRRVKCPLLTRKTSIINYFESLIFVCFACLTVFNATFNNISVISWRSVFIGGGNRRIRRKPPTCRKSLTNVII